MSCCGCLCVVVSITVLALSGTLLGVGITELTGEDAAPLAQLDGGQFRSAAIGTTAFGAAGLLIWLLTICGLLRLSWPLLLVGLLLLLAMFIFVRFDDIAGHFDFDFDIGDFDFEIGDFDDIAAAMNRSLSHYRDNPAVEHAWDAVQQKLYCCGVTNGSDWAPLLGTGHVPESCCRGDGGPAATNCTATDGANTEGCAVTVQAFIVEHRAWSVAVATAAASLVLLLLIAGVVNALCTGGGSSSGYSPLLSRMTQAALDNRANQLNPNNWRYQGRR